MTWTLRFYDSDGTEICWVTADPYGWSITHPDGESAWNGLEASLEHHRDPDEYDVVHETYGTWHFTGQHHTHNDLTPKEHLEKVRDNNLQKPEIDTAQLADE